MDFTPPHDDRMPKGIRYCCDMYRQPLVALASSGTEQPVKCKHAAVFEHLASGVLMCDVCVSMFVGGAARTLSTGPAWGRDFQAELAHATKTAEAMAAKDETN